MRSRVPFQSERHRMKFNHVVIAVLSLALAVSVTFVMCKAVGYLSRSEATNTPAPSVTALPATATLIPRIRSYPHVLIL